MYHGGPPGLECGRVDGGWLMLLPLHQVEETRGMWHVACGMWHAAQNSSQISWGRFCMWFSVYLRVGQNIVHSLHR